MLFFINKKRSHKETKGFTLVESLVAISILMIAIVTPMSIAQKGLGSANYSKDQMVASFLAQDALEYIKNKRDEIGLKKIPTGATTTFGWLGADIYNNCVDKTCYIDTISGDISQIRDNLYIRRNGQDFLYYGKDIGLGSDASKSKFIREIKITLPNNNNEALITVKVLWQNNTAPESVEIKNFIYNYWENL